MVTVAIAKNLTSYIPMMYADNIEQGLQVCRLLKEIEPKEVYTVVSSADHLTLTASLYVLSQRPT